MRLVDRIGTLLRADAHGVMESIEDRRLLAKQCVRDAKIALDDKRARVQALRSDQHRLSQEVKRLGTVMARLDDDIRLALQGNDEQLARVAIRKLLPLREADRRLTTRLATLHDEEKRLVERLVVQEQELEVLKARVQAELAVDDVACRSEGDGYEQPVVTDDDVELELLRRRGARGSTGGSPSEADAGGGQGA